MKIDHPKSKINANERFLEGGNLYPEGIQSSSSISAGYISLFTSMLPEESFKMICQSVSLAYYEGNNGTYFLVKARVEMCEHLFSI